MSVIILLVFLAVISFSLAIDCPYYKCNQFSNSTCATVNPVASSIGGLERYEVTTKLCGGTQECALPAVSSFSGNAFQNYECREKNYLPLVDGETCQNNAECASGSCDSHCRGFKLNVTCTNTNQCVTGSYCDSEKKICVPQKKFNAACSATEECINQAGCLNKTCTKYWSLLGGSNIGDNSLAELFCVSGYSYDGICATLINIDENPYQCNSTCNYSIKENNREVSIPELCKCGINSVGSKYCQLGGDSVSFKKYVELSMSDLGQPCHVSKKYNCNNQINYLDIMNIKNYYNSWKGLYQLSDECLIEFWSDASFVNFSLIKGFRNMVLALMFFYLLI